MADPEEFLEWVKTTLYYAEVALHNGNAKPRRALWSRNEPVSVLGAWRNAHGQRELDELFTALAASFSDCTSYTFELQACDVVGEMASRIPFRPRSRGRSRNLAGRCRTFRCRSRPVL